MESPYEVLYYEDGGRCRTEEFLDTLTGECEAKAYLLLEKLANHGPTLPVPKTAEPLAGKQKGLWELKDHCPRRAIRFYYWQSGPKQYTVAWGELKEGKKANKAVLEYATACFQESRKKGRKRRRA